VIKKKCIKCGKTLPLNKFAVRTGSKDGYRNSCLKCENKRKSIHARLKHDLTFDRHNRYINSNTKMRKAISCLNIHKRRGYEIKITSKEIVDMMDNTTHCPICGIELDYNRYPIDIWKMPSVDRLNNEVFMTPNNVWIICRKCNTAKGDLSIKDFLLYCDRISNNIKQTELGRYL
jgi:5-methylcytosine-specific restriction endonuclease McrA